MRSWSPNFSRIEVDLLGRNVVEQLCDFAGLEAAHAAGAVLDRHEVDDVDLDVRRIVEVRVLDAARSGRSA